MAAETKDKRGTTRRGRRTRMEEGARRKGGGGPASPPTKAYAPAACPRPAPRKARFWPPRIDLHSPHMYRARGAAPRMARPSHVSCPRCVAPPHMCRATLNGSVVKVYGRFLDLAAPIWIVHQHSS
eukprot:7119306-Pyramimonas_sp.AAC.1